MGAAKIEVKIKGTVPIEEDMKRTHPPQYTWKEWKEIYKSRGNRSDVPSNFEYEVLWYCPRTNTFYISKHGRFNRVWWSSGMDRLGWVEIGEWDATVDSGS